jgi:hypothetical protein
MKTIYKVKVTIKMGDFESECYADAAVVDDGEEGGECEMKFDSVEQFLRYRTENPEKFPPPRSRPDTGRTKASDLTKPSG